MPRLILASTSRYRREMLQRLGLPFDVSRPDVDETPHANEAPAALALRLAIAKAQAVAAQFPQLRFVWLDVEEQEDVLGDWDVETFPTVLLGRGTQVQFLGPILPQPGVLQRLVENLCAVALPPQVVPEAGQALLQRVQGAAKT